jgi:hypothetical protein
MMTYHQLNLPLVESMITGILISVLFSSWFSAFDMFRWAVKSASKDLSHYWQPTNFADKSTLYWRNSTDAVRTLWNTKKINFHLLNERTSIMYRSLYNAHQIHLCLTDPPYVEFTTFFNNIYQLLQHVKLASE